MIVLASIVGIVVFVRIIYPLLFVILFLVIVPKITQEFIFFSIPKDPGVLYQSREIITTGIFQEDLVLNQTTNLSADDLENFYQNQVEKKGWKKIKGDCERLPDTLNCIFAYTRNFWGANYMLSFPINKYKSEPTIMRFTVRTY